MAFAVTHLWRHPIKAHGAEALDAVTLTKGQTMPWDRTWAVAHEAAKTMGGDWVPCNNFSRGAKAPGLMAIAAKLNEDTEEVTLSHPDLAPITLHPERDADRLVAWTKSLIPEDRAASSRVVRVAGRGMTDANFASISIMSLASLAAFGDVLGQTLSPLRFRGNIWFDGAAPWAEFDWVGQTLRIGTAELKVEERIKRCMATTANPETGKRDADTLGALTQNWGHNDFGIVGIVTRTGRVAVGDTLEVLR